MPDQPAASTTSTPIEASVCGWTAPATAPDGRQSSASQTITGSPPRGPARHWRSGADQADARDRAAPGAARTRSQAPRPRSGLVSYMFASGVKSWTATSPRAAAASRTTIASQATRPRKAGRAPKPPPRPGRRRERSRASAAPRKRLRPSRGVDPAATSGSGPGRSERARPQARPSRQWPPPHQPPTATTGDGSGSAATDLDAPAARPTPDRSTATVLSPAAGS